MLEVRIAARRLVAAILAPLLACTPNVHVRRRDGATPDVTLVTSSAPTVQVTEAEFTPAFRALGKEVPAWERPLETARQIFEVPERSGTYLYEVRTRRLMPAAADNPMLGEASEQEFVRDYFQWCGTELGPGDCLRLLDKNRTYSSHARYATAMAIGWRAAIGPMKEALRDTVSPAAVMGTLFAAMTMYLMLWVAPEPFTKAIAAAMTIWLIGYFGFDPLWRLAKAWRSLVDEADAALDFEALRRAGERFGDRAGPGAARMLILVATLAVGGGATGMATRGTSLPGFSLANAQAEGQLAVSLTAATKVESVLVGTQTVTITFAPGLLAMASATPHGTFEGSPKHTSAPRGNAAREPTNGQATLDRSVQVKPTSPRRVGADPVTGEFVVFDQHRPGTWHGHVRSWNELTDDMKNALVRGGLADRRGRIVGRSDENVRVKEADFTGRDSRCVFFVRQGQDL